MTSAVLVLALGLSGQSPQGAYPAAQGPGKVLPAAQAPAKFRRRLRLRARFRPRLRPRARFRRRRRLPSKIAPAPYAPSKVSPAPQAPSKIAPAPYAPGKVSPAPQAPSKIAPAPYAPGKVSPAPQAPSKIAPAPYAPARFRLPAGPARCSGAYAPGKVAAHAGQRLRRPTLPPRSSPAPQAPARSLRHPMLPQGFARPAGPEQGFSGALRLPPRFAGPAGSGQAAPYGPYTAGADQGVGTVLIASAIRRLDSRRTFRTTESRTYRLRPTERRLSPCGDVPPLSFRMHSSGERSSNRSNPFHRALGLMAVLDDAHVLHHHQPGSDHFFQTRQSPGDPLGPIHHLDAFRHVVGEPQKMGAVRSASFYRTPCSPASSSHRPAPGTGNAR